MFELPIRVGVRREGFWTIVEPSVPDVNGVYLLFASGKRPTRAGVREFSESLASVSITHDPFGQVPLRLVSADGTTVPSGSGRTKSEAGDTTWLELLRDGLAFDLNGLARGQPVGFPVIEHRFDLPDTLGPAYFEALHLTPGRHLAGGERSMPVAKALIGLARDLVHHFEDLEAIVWPPANSAIGRRFFESVVTAWLQGGAFPALGLTAFKETIDGALQSVGLDFWIGQELRIEPPLSSERVAATRLGVRLINQLILLGGMEGSERVTAPDGSQLVLRASRNGRFIRAMRD